MSFLLPSIIFSFTEEVKIYRRITLLSCVGAFCFFPVHQIVSANQLTKKDANQRTFRRSVFFIITIFFYCTRATGTQQRPHNSSCPHGMGQREADLVWLMHKLTAQQAARELVSSCGQHTAERVSINATRFIISLHLLKQHQGDHV